MEENLWKIACQEVREQFKPIVVQEIMEIYEKSIPQESKEYIESMLEEIVDKTINAIIFKARK